MQTCLVKEEEHKEEKGQRWEERTRVGGEGEEEQGLRETMMMTSRRKCKKSGFGCNIFNIIKMIEEKITINITQDKENSEAFPIKSGEPLLLEQ